MGIIPRAVSRDTEGAPRIWIHAVSLGEVKAAIPVTKALREILPDCSILFSTTTQHGRSLAAKSLRDIPIFYAPIDVGFSVRKALSRARPDVMVFMETELWPLWIWEANSRGIKTALINGRISPRSIGTYLRFRTLFRHVLGKIDVFSMISDQDANRIVSLGADPKNVVVNGNSKYELLIDMARPGIEQEMRTQLNLQGSQKVFIAGSIRKGEEKLILEVYEALSRTFPNMVLVIAPRHIKRTRLIEEVLKSRGIRYQLRTDLEKPGTKRTEPVVIINNFGELFKLYSVGDIIFCGGSLIPVGGQNPLEAAVWGKVVFYGPSMEDFLDAKAMLEAVKAGIMVSKPEEFCEKASWLLDHPEINARRGTLAREAIARNQGAARRHAGIVADLLRDHGLEV
ncbi:MAG: hypothetical protein JRJ31_22065 [Deltaproteobacteria bacterium]|nr:hypothetical protein [Deltaproteobacteria bacterium]